LLKKELWGISHPDQLGLFFSSAPRPRSRTFLFCLRFRFRYSFISQGIYRYLDQETAKDSAVGAGDAVTSPSCFFGGQIWVIFR